MLNVLVGAMTLLLMNGCIGGAAGNDYEPTAAEIYFPLVPGSEWEYRSTRTIDGVTQIYEYSVHASHEWYEYVVLEVREYNNVISESYVRHDSASVVGKWNYNAVEEQVLYDLAAAPGESWEVHRMFDGSGYRWVETVTYDGVFSIESPAGSFSGAKRFTGNLVRYPEEFDSDSDSLSAADSITTVVWLAPYVGKVRSVEYHQGNSIIDELTDYAIPEK